MKFIGDVHGHFNEYKERLEDGPTIQLGDFGIGLMPFPEMESHHRFIRGNHDNPSRCKEHPNYLGDWGYLEADDIFFVSGASSIDWKDRTPGYDWWPEEQLPIEELEKAVDLYKFIKPRIVISHDCPFEPRQKIIKNNLFRTRTDWYLQLMLDAWRPSVWLFGHHHMSFRHWSMGTQFICLNVLETETL